MYLLVFLQKEEETAVGLFGSIEAGRRFASLLPGYRISEEVVEDSTFCYETFDPESLPDYKEIGYNGNRVPLTRFMFKGKDPVEIIWREIPNMEEPDQGLVESQTRVDAYVIGNDELEAYIAKREETYKRVEAELEKRGYEVARDFRGSEDGEAIVVKGTGDGNWHFLTHMDPCFVDEVPTGESEFREWIERNLPPSNA